jgi:hypothetical protein
LTSPTRPVRPLQLEPGRATVLGRVVSDRTGLRVLNPLLRWRRQD